MDDLTLQQLLGRTHRYALQHWNRFSGTPSTKPVQLSLKVLELYAASVKTGSFCLKIKIIARWLCPSEHAEDSLKEGGSGLDHTWTPKWAPYFTIASTNRLHVEYSAFCAEKDETETVWITGDWTFSAEIKEAYDLHAFPFDIQDFNIHVQMTNTDNSLVLQPLSEIRHKMPTFSKRAKQSLRKPKPTDPPVLIANKGLDLPDFVTMSGNSQDTALNNLNSAAMYRLLPENNEVHLVLLYERHPKFYIINFMILLFGITTFTVFGWAIAWQKVESRLSLNVTLLLTTVAFKQVLAGSIPPISYLTRLDVYALGCLAFLAMSTAMHGFIGFIIDACDANGECTFFFNSFDNSSAHELDVIFLITWSTAWVAANFLYAYTVRRRMVQARNAFSIKNAQSSGFQMATFMEGEAEKEWFDQSSFSDSDPLASNPQTQREMEAAELLPVLQESDGILRQQILESADVSLQQPLATDFSDGK